MKLTSGAMMWLCILGGLALLIGRAVSDRRPEAVQSEPQPQAPAQAPAPTPPAEPTPQVQNTGSLEYRLAMLDAGVNQVQDSTVARFRYLLDSLARNTTTPPDQMVSATVAVQEIIHREHGRYVTLLHLMEQASPIATAHPGDSYTDVIGSVLQHEHTVEDPGGRRR